MDLYDIVIVGAGLTGAALAEKLAARHHRVLVIEKRQPKTLDADRAYLPVRDEDLRRLGLPVPQPGDPAYAFGLTEIAAADPKNRNARGTSVAVTGVHTGAYLGALRARAEAKGAEFLFGAAFRDFLWDDGRIGGVICETNGETVSIPARVVADCAGAASPVRAALPDGDLVDNATPAGEDLLYVTLRHIEFKKEADAPDGCRVWPLYGAWILPTAPGEAAIGVASTHGFAYNAAAFRRMEAELALPAYAVKKEETRVAPAAPFPESFVTERYVVCGDAAGLVNPVTGEGFSAAAPLLEIAAKVLDRRLRTRNTTKEALWEINQKYFLTCGADLFFARALTDGAFGALSFDEWTYAFESGLFSDATAAALYGGPLPAFPAGFFRRMNRLTVGAALRGKLSRSTAKAFMRAFTVAKTVKAHYTQYPASPDGFEKWRADAAEILRQLDRLR